MAFVAIEDKTGEGEVIVFPNLYEQIGAKLVQDAVIKATGKISARDRDGNLGTEAKMIADEIQFLTDKELDGYESTGSKMQAPKLSNKVKVERVNNFKKSSGYKNTATTAKPSAPAAEHPIRTIIDEVPVIKKLYVHIKNPDDHDMLLALKQASSQFIGASDIVLVLGDEKKSAIKLPFRVEPSDAFIGTLVKILGEDSVVLK
jgi:DNA polymerase III alpha subunit